MADAVDIFTREARNARVDASDDACSGHVEIAESLLDRVRTGNIRTFAVAGVSEDGTVTMWTGSIFKDPHTMIGILEEIKDELLTDMRLARGEAVIEYGDGEE